VITFGEALFDFASGKVFILDNKEIMTSDGKRYRMIDDNTCWSYDDNCYRDVEYFKNLSKDYDR
jgi:hypothetical protein